MGSTLVTIRIGAPAARCDPYIGFPFRCASDPGYGAEEFAAHSLRAGFLTSAAAAGASISKMREVSRHKSVQLLSDYVRDSELFKDHAGEDFL